jgi:hypothetical protein
LTLHKALPCTRNISPTHEKNADRSLVQARVHSQRVDSHEFYANAQIIRKEQRRRIECKRREVVRPVRPAPSTERRVEGGHRVLHGLTEKRKAQLTLKKMKKNESATEFGYISAANHAWHIIYAPLYRKRRKLVRCSRRGKTGCPPEASESERVKR